MADFPEENELVTAVVKKILPYGAFCYLPEYNAEAFMHVSQVSSGWVKNIHEFLSEGQQLVVKVHRIDREKNQIDISLRRVTEDEKRRKQDAIRREKRGLKLLEFALKSSKSKEDIQKVKGIIEEHYDDVFGLFEDAHEEGEKALEQFDFPAKLKEEIVTIAKSAIKKPVVVLSGLATLACPGANGLGRLKEVLESDEKGLAVHYLGAPKYRLTLTADDYKQGEKSLSALLDSFEKKAKKRGCTFSFERDED